MKILFWNTNKNKDINPILKEVICENYISLVFLAEYEADISQLINILSENGVLFQHYATAGCKRITILGKRMSLSPGRQTDYSSFYIHNEKDIFCCVHLPSQIYSNNQGTRDIAITTVLADIESTEKEIGSDNTVIVGDFNINPFDRGCLDARYFHGVPVFEDAKRLRRTIAGKNFKMFYNPMWRFFGDTEKPYGTYYYTGNATKNTFWQIYDQVIIRPSLKNRFVNSCLQILTETKSLYLLNNRGHPNINISDHLPIVFEIKEDN